MFFSFLQWLLMFLIVLYLLLWVFGGNGKMAAAVLIAVLAILQAGTGFFMHWKWLGYPSPADYFMIYSDNYPGHGEECLRGQKIYYYQMEKIFPDDYEGFLERYGKPLVEERKDKSLTAKYSDFRAEFYIYEEHSLLEKVELIGGEIRLPLSGVKVGTRKEKAENAYRYNGKVTGEDGESYFLEDSCMLCCTEKRYRIRFEYDGGLVSKIILAADWLA